MASPWHTRKNIFLGSFVVWLTGYVSRCIDVDGSLCNMPQPAQKPPKGKRKPPQTNPRRGFVWGVGACHAFGPALRVTASHVVVGLQCMQLPVDGTTIRTSCSRTT